MRRDAHRIDLRHGRNLFRLPQTAAVAKVRLDHVTGLLLKQFTEFVTRDAPLTGRDCTAHSRTLSTSRARTSDVLVGRSRT